MVNEGQAPLSRPDERGSDLALEGRTLITLGREAFLWFGIGRSKEERARLESFWKSENRFESSIEVTLEDDRGEEQAFTLYPLPHPSPLNQTWYTRFPGLLKQRLEQLDVRPGNLTL
ncbi:hypothetical protein HORIV_61580 [Vreelandella olivaria]|uniref:Gelsolin n=1 Tax=Vreelandella olivaria TaxID=390919 RepID=A0ABM7GSE1_9GAMM|nr:hypothetical protein HORIV_61580 [Halomonas olivaria]